MTPKLKHWFYQNHLFVTFILFVLVFILWLSVGSLRTLTFLYPAVAGILGLSYFAFKQNLEEICLFKELFGEFNCRYDLINGPLNVVRNGPINQELTSDEIDLLYKYFNLCAEEYLYYRKGFLYPEVWNAWRNGMKIFAECPRIRSLWETELANNSYYGFTIPT